MKKKAFFLGYTCTLLLVVGCTLLAATPLYGVAIMAALSSGHWIAHPPLAYRLLIILLFLLNPPPFLLAGWIVNYITIVKQGRAIMAALIFLVLSAPWWWLVSVIVGRIGRRRDSMDGGAVPREQSPERR